MHNFNRNPPPKNSKGCFSKTSRLNNYDLFLWDLFAKLQHFLKKEDEHKSKNVQTKTLQMEGCNKTS